MTYCHGTWNEILNFERFVECMHFELNMQLLICAPLAMCHVELPWCMNQHYAILFKCVVCISRKLRIGSFKIHFSHMKLNYVPMSINLFILIFFCRIHLETKAINFLALHILLCCVPNIYNNIMRVLVHAVHDIYIIITRVLRCVWRIYCNNKL